MKLNYLIICGLLLTSCSTTSPTTSVQRNVRSDYMSREVRVINNSEFDILKHIAPDNNTAHKVKVFFDDNTQQEFLGVGHADQREEHTSYKFREFQTGAIRDFFGKIVVEPYHERYPTQ